MSFGPAHASKQVSAQRKSTEIYPTVSRIVLLGIALVSRTVKDIYYTAGGPDVLSGMQPLRGSPCRKRRAQDSTSERPHSEAGRRKKVTEETRDRQSELGR